MLSDKDRNKGPPPGKSKRFGLKLWVGRTAYGIVLC